MRPGKYVAVAWTSARQTLSSPAVLVMRGAFFLVILLIFSRLWSAVAEKGTMAGLGPASFVWYLALTEWVVLSTPMIFIDIMEEVQRGDVAYLVIRPASYVGTRLAEGAGQLVVNLLALGTCGFAGAWLFAGGLPEDPRGLAVAPLVVLLASGLMLLFQALIGLTSFWIVDANPVYWIFQKLCFVLGGLLFPLAVYPGWLRAIAEATPFAAMICGSGSLALGLEVASVGATVVRLIAWTAVFTIVLAWLNRRALRALTAEGG